MRRKRHKFNTLPFKVYPISNRLKPLKVQFQHVLRSNTICYFGDSLAIELFLEKRMLEFLANAEEPDEEDAEGRGC